jgi:rare lipoprotein A
MRSRAKRVAGTSLLCLLLVACAGSDRPRQAGGGSFRRVFDTPVRIGPPYTVRGVTYVPREERGYDEIGMASWYGSESGNRTANGERFVPDFITAAHKTLPLPSYVEVTALDTGRTILLRINDRGPFAAGRIIDLSRGSAAALGIVRAGSARVRVRRVDPPERDRAALRGGRMASFREAAPLRRAEPAEASTLRRTLPAAPLPLPPRPLAPPTLSPAPVAPRLQLDLPPPEPETLSPVVESNANYPPQPQ